MSTTKNASANGVKAKSGAAKDLNELFLDSLKDIYWAENALTKAIPKMAENASTKKLKDALDDHLKETKEQISRLDEAFEMIDEKAEGKKCDAMAGIIAEGEDIMKETESGKVRDAGIIAAGQKVEHYEIATYGTLIAWAEELGIDDVAKILKKTLKEEKAADKKLSELATQSINQKAK
ncbi:ferritin-like domain-containing protein [Cryomorpha ignava]|uniref:Ferritin-like domain-containing protein n=1 Tax=Cryomorpha ignava TaxID=101383 RepID=A0A7K3WU86_9FLAO|nr:ferritin-like domain-containing protein [Cryomorpha ignava]NEN24225.1 ferritin-like domain-containing protein [Cryomorpha ignava]